MPSPELLQPVMAAPVSMAAALLLAAAFPFGSAWAQKQGGVLRARHRDSPASMSIHEEGTISVVLPMMGVFNDFVMFDQHKRQNSLDDIVPDLAEKWTWSEDGKKLTFALRSGVNWHDGKPFTAADVEVHAGHLGRPRVRTRFKVNSRDGWYADLARGDHVSASVRRCFTFAAAARLACAARLGAVAGLSLPRLPREMRQTPVGTGPFKFVEYKGSQNIKLARNPNYWKTGRPYLDGIEYTIITNRSTVILGLRVPGSSTLTFPYEITVPLVKRRQEANTRRDVRHHADERGGQRADEPEPPFDDLEVRRVWSLDAGPAELRQHPDDGQGDIGGAMMPPPGGLGPARGDADELPGYSPTWRPDAEARRIMTAAKATARTSPAGQDLDAQPADLPRRLGDPDRPVKKRSGSTATSQLIETAQWVPPS